MASIPLPALSVNPPAPQQNPLDTFMRMTQLKSMQNSQALQAEQLHGEQLRNQMSEIGAADEMNGRAAFLGWNTSTGIDGLMRAMQKAGVGPKTFTAVAAGLTDLAQKTATLTGDQLKNVTTMGDQARGQIMSVVNAPADKQQDAWSQLKKDAYSNPLFAPLRSQIDLMPDEYPGDEEATMAANHLALGSVLAKEATEATAAGARAKQADTDWQRFQAQYPGIQSENKIKAAAAGVAPQLAQLGVTQKQVDIAKAVADTAKTKIETQNLGALPMFAVDPATNQRVMTTREEATAKGYTNVVPVKEGDVQKQTDAVAMTNDVQINLSRYRVAMNRMYQEPVNAKQAAALAALTPEKLGFDIGHGFGLNLPDVFQKLTNANAFSVLSPTQKQAMLGYYSTLASVPAAQKALTNIGKANKEMMDLELRTIPTPLMDPETYNLGMDRFQGNITQTAAKNVRIPGMPSTSDIRNQIENPRQQQQQPRFPNTTGNFQTMDQLMGLVENSGH